MNRKIYKPGIYDIPNEEYHASGGLSRTALWTFNKLPYKYWYEHLSGEYKRPEPSDAFVVGSMTHTLLLEPHKFDDEYFLMPKVNRATKQGKSDYAEAMLLSGSRTAVKPDLWDMAHQMRDAVNKDETAREILSDSQNEKTIFWEDQETGLLCKVRPDIWRDPLVADLKTCRDASPRAFQRAAMDDGYYLQAAMIYEATRCLGVPFEKFVFICVEKTAPYFTGLYVLDDASLQYGLDLFRSILIRFKSCLELNEWPGYGIQNLGIPKYATSNGE